MIRRRTHHGPGERRPQHVPLEACSTVGDHAPCRIDDGIGAIRWRRGSGTSHVDRHSLGGCSDRREKCEHDRDCRHRHEDSARSSVRQVSSFPAAPPSFRLQQEDGDRQPRWRLCRRTHNMCHRRHGGVTRLDESERLPFRPHSARTAPPARAEAAAGGPPGDKSAGAGLQLASPSGRSGTSHGSDAPQAGSAPAQRACVSVRSQSQVAQRGSRSKSGTGPQP